MKAGRKLDALMAEKVMGWKREQPLYEDAPDSYAIWGEGGNAIIYYGDDDPLEITGLPHYSTRIEDAWLVVEHLSDYHDHDIFIENWRDGEWCCFTMPMVSSIWPDGGRPGACAATAPLAICLAALEAVGYEIPS